MSRELFGTDGVRGKAGTHPLDNSTVTRIGMAVAAYFAKPGEFILIGRDTRESSPQIVASLIAGITAAGVDVRVVGVVPTAGLAYLTGRTDAAAGIMVTASHNPYQDNGIKVFDAHGSKLPDTTEEKLTTLIKRGVKPHHFGSWQCDETLVKEYEDLLVTSAGGSMLDGLTLAVDTANGAASGLAERVFTRLGATIVPLADAPDGRNINASCGATDTRMLQREVTAQGLQAGAAFDGDADRLVLVDEKGREFTGDHILYTLAVAGSHRGIVATIMTNMGMEIALADRGISLHRVSVGDRYVLEGLQKTNLKLGGEQSGHIILPDILNTGDGLLAAIQTLLAIKASGRSLAEWRDDITLLPQALVNVPVKNKSLADSPEVRTLIQEQTEAFGGNGRVLIRPSGTEPLVRVMVEGTNAQETAEAAAAKLKLLLNPKGK
jgi:phosphoglucosamine mutase